jgi:hypothetical protein
MYRRNFPRTKERHTLQRQICKVFEEANEAERELEMARKKAKLGQPASAMPLIVELLDVVHAVETMLDDLNATQEQVAMAHDAVIRKNRARGYYEEER